MSQIKERVVAEKSQLSTAKIEQAKLEGINIGVRTLADFILQDLTAAIARAELINHGLGVEQNSAKLIVSLIAAADTLQSALNATKDNEISIVPDPCDPEQPIIAFPIKPRQPFVPRGITAKALQPNPQAARQEIMTN